MQPEAAAGSSVRVAAVAADFAAVVLAQRFGAPGSSGIGALVDEAAAGETQALGFKDPTMTAADAGASRPVAVP